MKVLIADDQEEVRSALMLLLEHNGDAYEIDGAGSLDELMKKAGSERYDILLLDWELTSNMNISMIKKLRKLSPGLGIIAMSVHLEAAASALKNGADMFISKGENSDRLIEAIHEVGKRTGHQAR